MLDLWKWIYAEDLAGWLSHRPPLDIPEQIDCILAAPHRTFREKLEGLRELREEEMDPRNRKALEEYLDRGDQWLLYPDFLHSGSSTGIGAIPLDDYASLTFGADFLLPFRQFLRRCKGELSEEERWLSKLGRMVEEDKAYVSRIMKDSRPKGSPSRYERGGVM